MRQLSSSVAVAAVLLLVSGSEPRAVAQAPTMDGFPAVGSPPTIKLLAAGAEPRTALRYRVPNGYKATLSLSMAMSMAMKVGEMEAPQTELPVMTMTADVAVTNVAPNGDITYNLAFTGMTAEQRPGIPPAVIAAMEQSAAGIRSITGTATLSDRGISRALKIDASRVGDPNLKNVMDSMTTSFESMSMPLPEEPVGVGARWEVRQAFRSGGTALFQRSECELISIEGNAVRWRVKFDQTAPRQIITNPALPPEATMEVETITGSGSGTMTLRLDGLIPNGDLSNSSSALMNVSMGGQSQQMRVDTKMSMTIGTKSK